MKCTAFYIRPKGNFKTELHSDTLWGQLCWAIRMVYGNDKLEDFIKAYENEDRRQLESNGVFISSLFTYSEQLKEEQREKILFFPNLKIPVASSIKDEDKSQNDIKKGFNDSIQNLREQKKIKKRKTLSQPLFEYQFADQRKNLNTSAPPIKERLAFTHTAINRLTNNALVRYRPRNSEELAKQTNINLDKLDDFEDLGQLYHTDEYTLKNGKDTLDSGFFFLAKGSDDKLKMIEAALRFLSHFGIGGDRTLGKGHFEYLGMEGLTIAEPPDANAVATLALYHPTQEELIQYEQSTDRVLNYKLLVRKGKGSLWQDNPDKDAIMMFEEGSVFPMVNNDSMLYGNNEIVAVHEAGFKIRHYGFAFMIKVKIK